MASDTPDSVDRPAPPWRLAHGRRTGAGKTRPAISTAVAFTVLLGTGLFTTAYVQARSRSSKAPLTSSTALASPTPALANAVAVMATTKPMVDWDKVLGNALEDVAGSAAARYSVAVLDMDSGDSAVYGSGSYDTASIVKVDILATLLLQAQDKGRRLTAQEKAHAKVMIENSDNTAAGALWRGIGEAAGLNAANRRLGLTETTGGNGALWGLTQTTAADQLRLLKAVFGTDSVLSDGSRRYLRTLMGQVSTAQDWGVSSASSGDFEVKNGWLQRSRTALWDINSIGRVNSGRHTYLVAVTSKGSSTMTGGVALVEEAAQTAVKAFTKATASSGSES